MEEATITGSTHTANVEKVNLMVENSTEKELYGESKLYGNEAPTKVEPDFADTHKLHPQASIEHTNFLAESD